MLAGSRKKHILQTLAKILEEPSERKVTTVLLAQEVGVSEAALYRHFPSKMKIYEALIQFIEETILSRVSVIIKVQQSIEESVNQILSLILVFSEKNPGLSRILNGDALIGESRQLLTRINNLFDFIKVQIKQLLQFKIAMQPKLHHTRPLLDPREAANFMVCFVEGLIKQYVRSNFKIKPTTNWSNQWLVFEKLLCSYSDTRAP